MTARVRCPDCRIPVLRFVDDVGLTEHVDVEPLSPLATQPARHHMWERHTVGWFNAPLGFRGWPIHVTHTCCSSTSPSTSQRRSTA